MKQMLDAPKDAVFIWINNDLWYPRQLAHRIKREDLRIKPPTFLEDHWRGLNLSDIVVDHSAKLTDNQWEGYQAAYAYFRQRSTHEKSQKKD